MTNQKLSEIVMRGNYDSILIKKLTTNRKDAITGACSNPGSNKFVSLTTET
jgi:hypothetical protein